MDSHLFWSKCSSWSFIHHHALFIVTPKIISGYHIADPHSFTFRTIIWYLAAKFNHITNEATKNYTATSHYFHAEKQGCWGSTSLLISVLASGVPFCWWDWSQHFLHSSLEPIHWSLIKDLLRINCQITSILCSTCCYFTETGFLLPTEYEWWLSCTQHEPLVENKSKAKNKKQWTYETGKRATLHWFAHTKTANFYIHESPYCISLCSQCNTICSTTSTEEALSAFWLNPLKSWIIGKRDTITQDIISHIFNTW